MSEMIFLASYTYPHEAQMAKLKLDAEGIDCYLKDELTVQAHHFISNAVGGIKLMVKPEDFEAAKNLLTEAGLIQKPEGPVCSNCGSDNVGEEKKAGIALILSLLFFGIPLPFFKKSFFCFDCRHNWKD